jgi:replication-associated recombination protein RarA
MSATDPVGTRPSLLLLFGPPAVGKTTVGQELEQLTGFRLFHIHQVIDLVTQYFPYLRSADSPCYRLLAQSSGAGNAW